jgi:dipeptidyl aminopeptidase/acylaminoacyl peptidase
MRSRVVLLVPIVLLSCSLGCGNSKSTKPLPVDATPPVAITDLDNVGQPGREVHLTWRAPGDDGASGRAASYDLRCSPDSLVNDNWSAAIRLSVNFLPATTGQWENFKVTGLAVGTWYFAIKSADEIPNWSGLSNVVKARVVDLIPPAAIADLAILSTNRNRVTLSWTATGEDGSAGRAAQYDLRYAPGGLSTATWGHARAVTGLPSPGPAGSMDSVTVLGLPADSTFYFALRAQDASGNWSEISNVVSASAISVYLRRLTFSPAGRGARSPAWSPDGQQIAFSADWNGGYEIYRMPAAGGEAVRLGGQSGTNLYPAWSPDGSKIAFTSDRSGHSWLMTMDATDGGHAIPLADEQTQAFFASPATWSPDGTQLAYVVGEPGMNFSPTEIRVISSSGGTSTRLVGGEYANLEPAWSPDGMHIAFVSARTIQWEIWLVSAAGGDETRLTFDNGNNRLPFWLPDGSKIAFVSIRSPLYMLRTVPATGGAEYQIAAWKEGIWRPAGSPNGREIAFESSRSGSSEVWIMEME